MRVKIRFMRLQRYTWISQRRTWYWSEKIHLDNFSDYSDKHELLKTLKKSIDPENIMGPKVFLINRIRTNQL